MSSRFIGREREIQALDRELDGDGPSLVVVYGRRRVGKSTLLAHVTRARHTIFYQATQVVGSLNLALLKEEAARALGAQEPVLEGIEHWEALLTYVAEAAQRVPGLVLVLDEFPYLCEAVDGLPSIVQKVFDQIVQRRLPFNLVLCGSKISFMEGLLGETNPLRGRPTLELDLEPFTYREAAAFLPGWRPVDRLAAYGVFGGMPYYLQFCDPDRSLARNIQEVILEPGTPLSTEADNVLRAELTTPTRYATILQAIARGCTTTGEILARTGEISDSRGLAPYLQKLEALRLIEITRSLNASPKARNRRYYLRDPFLAFWYRFRLPNSSALAVGHARAVYDRAVRPQFDTYLGEVFEWITRQYVRHYGSEVLPAPARDVGKIWGPDFDLDLAATLLDGTVLYGECKWSAHRVGRAVLDKLRADSERSGYGRAAAHKRLLLASRSGFNRSLEDAARGTPSLHLVSPRELLGPRLLR